MGFSKIPWGSIRNYVEFYDFSQEQAEDLFYYIKAMDDALLTRYNNKSN